jgi:tetratricopeptide (TPR) repeat protein
MFLSNRLPALVLTGLAVALVGSLPQAASAAKKQEAEQPAEGPVFTKEFRKIAAPIQKDFEAKKWPEVLEGLAKLEALPELTQDERKAILGWRYVALQATGDKAGLMATLEAFLEGGFASPDQLGPMNQSLAAWYNSQQDMPKTISHYRAFIDATADPKPDELVTMGRLYLQSGDDLEGITWLNKAIAAAKAQGEKPKELWFQLMDGSYVALNDSEGRMNNLEGLVANYPKNEYYTRILSIYAQGSKDDRTVMLNAYRLAFVDVGLATVGEYLGYADEALTAGSPGEALRALERGTKDGIVPSVGTSQQTVQEARTAVARDKKDLPADAAAAAKNPKGEMDVKVGLGFYSQGDWNKSIEAVRRGLGKGGVKRVDDANILLGASLIELGKYAEAKAAFAAAAAASTDSYVKRLAGLWIALADRRAGASEAG